MKTDSMTNLLKQTNSKIYEVKANKILVEIEILEDNKWCQREVFSNIDLYY